MGETRCAVSCGKSAGARAAMSSLRHHRPFVTSKSRSWFPHLAQRAPKEPGRSGQIITLAPSAIELPQTGRLPTAKHRRRESCAVIKPTAAAPPPAAWAISKRDNFIFDNGVTLSPEITPAVLPRTGRRGYDAAQCRSCANLSPKRTLALNPPRPLGQTLINLVPSTNRGNGKDPDAATFLSRKLRLYRWQHDHLPSDAAASKLNVNLVDSRSEAVILDSEEKAKASDESDGSHPEQPDHNRWRA
jgi:hypothetical protein